MPCAFDKKRPISDGRVATGCQFDGREFGDNAQFGAERPTEFGVVGFGKAIFRARVVFNNRNFMRHADFSSAKFFEAPAFRNSLLHQGTDFTNTEFFWILRPLGRRAHIEH